MSNANQKVLLIKLLPNRKKVFKCSFIGWFTPERTYRISYVLHAISVMLRTVFNS